jgi:riboflavin synthase
MIIAHTQEKVIIAGKKVGDDVNVEVDLMGKLIEKQVAALIAKQTDSSLEKLVERIVDRKLTATKSSH